jgi:two-component system, OmpR family, sensor histidine kinase TctE
VDLGVQGLEQAVWVAGNTALIEGVLGNLIDNALRYGQPPQGQVSRVTVLLSQESGAVTLSVVDNGPGLSREQQQQLMQRWAQGAAGERLGQGAGLGLAIVAKFAQVMSAKFELASPAERAGLIATLVFRALSRP